MNASTLAPWLGVQSIPFLYERCTDISVTLSEVDVPKEGASGGACAALAMLLLLGGSLVQTTRFAMTGTLDLRGRVREVGSVREKILHARQKGFPLMMVPLINLEKLEREGWKDEEERDYVIRSVRGVDTFVDVMEAVVQGKLRGDYDIAVIHGIMSIRDGRC